MVLHTRLVDDGLQLATTRTLDMPPEWHTFPVPSETFLRTIQQSVVERGGWQALTDWVTSVQGNSFTSLRGLLTLVNVLTPMHHLGLWTIGGDGNRPVRAQWPLTPEYHMEPSITRRSTGSTVAKLQS